MIRFGSSGIRGLVNRDITPELAVSLGRVLGAGYNDVVVGRDVRVSGEMLSQAITAGLLSSGASVTDIGVVSTPTLAFETRGHDCGVMVTASHNPAPYNGMKLWNPNGRAFDTAQQELVENGMDSGEPSRAAWEETGKYKRQDGASRRHSDAIASALGRLTRDIRVVLDCGGGAGSTVTPVLLKNIGVETVALNAHIDGSFSARPPEPTRENLALLSDTVRDTGADIGIAHDGDADRMVATDENGRVLDGDVLFCLFARWLGARSVVCPVDMSSAAELNLPGVAVTRTRVGDVYVAATLASEGADFGGEASGTWIFPEWSLAPDGPYAAAFLCKLVAEHGSLAKAVDEIKRLVIRRGKFECKDNLKDVAMNLISAELEKNGPLHVSRLDGIMVETDGGRMLVRPSGTEPVLRLLAEAKNSNELERLWDLLETAVRKSQEGLN
jgi:phosphoglucosamine mutase